MLEQVEPAKIRGALKSSMWNDSNFVAEPKLDGVRSIMHVTSEGSRFTSRHRSVKDNLFVEKTDNFPHLATYDNFPGFVFDGEIVAGSTVTDVTKITGAKPKKAIEYQKKHGFVEYHIFDILRWNGKDITSEPYSIRSAKLQDCFDLDLSKNKFIKLVPIESLDKRSMYEDIIRNGGEGVILKDIRQPYGQGWAKAKRSAHYDVIITGFEDPKQITKKVSGEESESKYYEKGWIGAIRFGQYYNGKIVEFGRTSGFNDDIREKISNNKEYYIGKVIEIEAQERLKSGKFRHPRFIRFRDDKNSVDCIYRSNES